jgi:hypothetical protein
MVYANNKYIYIGKWLDGQPDGIGKMIYRNEANETNETNEDTYIGQWKSGQPSGIGQYTYKPDLVVKAVIDAYDVNSENVIYSDPTTIQKQEQEIYITQYTGNFNNNNYDGLGYITTSLGKLLADWLDGYIKTAVVSYRNLKALYLR